MQSKAGTFRGKCGKEKNAKETPIQMMVMGGRQVLTGVVLVKPVNPERSFIARWCCRVGL